MLLLLALLNYGIADIYNFRVSLGTVADGMQATNSRGRPQPQDSKERALIFRKYPPIAGWTATFLNCAGTLKDCEVRLNARGATGFPRSSAPERRYDIGFSMNADGTMRVRCFREKCLVDYGKAKAEKSTVTLEYGESRSLPVDIDISLR